MYDELKTTTVAFNKLLLGRLFLIGSKIYQLINLNSGFTNEPEQLVNTVKLSYYSDWLRLFNSNTILNEFLLKETANISTHYSLLKNYMNEKSYTRIVNNVDVTTSFSFDGTDLTKTVSSTQSTILDSDLLSEIKIYFNYKLDELSDSSYSSIVEVQTIDPFLYYISSNDYLSEIYINIVNNLYYDDLVDKKSREIGTLFNSYVNDSESINETVIRNIIENEILVHNSIHILSDKDTYIDRINIRYNKTGVSSSFELLFLNLLENIDIINKVANIDFFRKSFHIRY